METPTRLPDILCHAALRNQISARRWKQFSVVVKINVVSVKKPNLREEMETRRPLRLVRGLRFVKKPNLREEMETCSAGSPQSSSSWLRNQISARRWKENLLLFEVVFCAKFGKQCKPASGFAIIDIFDCKKDCDEIKWLGECFKSS